MVTSSLRVVAVNVILDVDKVEFAPTLKQLANVVNSISGFLTESISEVKRLPELLAKRKTSKKVGVGAVYRTLQ